MSKDDGKQYVMSQEAMERLGGEETFIKIYKECNPKIDHENIVSHDVYDHNYWISRHGLCPYCNLGSKVVIKSEEVKK